MTDRSLWRLPQPPDNRGCLAVKQVFETYVYAYTLSSVRHEPFIVEHVRATQAEARSVEQERVDRAELSRAGPQP